MKDVNWVQTANGGWNFDTMSWIGSFRLREDIAETLAGCNRFKGSTKPYWAVAAHACVMTRTAMEMGLPPAQCFAILRHDNHEAITGDVSSPLKRVLGPALDIIQLEIQESLDVLEGVPIGWRSQDFPTIVREYDIAAYHVERLRFLRFPVLPIAVPTNAVFLAMRGVMTQCLYEDRHSDGGAKDYMELYEELSAHYQELA